MHSSYILQLTKEFQVHFDLDLKSPKNSSSSLDHLFSHPLQHDTVYNAENPYQCILQSSSKHQWALARIIVFQQDGGEQLKNLLTHYGQVLPYDSIVVIDHQGQDGATAALLNEYSLYGVHVWRCEGKWKHKSFMCNFVGKCSYADVVWTGLAWDPMRSWKPDLLKKRLNLEDIPSPVRRWGLTSEDVTLITNFSG